MTIMPPSPFVSATVETLPSEFSGKSHCSDGSFTIDEDSFFYAIDPPPLVMDGIDAAEIEQILRVLRTA